MREYSSLILIYLSLEYLRLDPEGGKIWSCSVVTPSLLFSLLVLCYLQSYHCLFPFSISAAYFTLIALFSHEFLVVLIIEICLCVSAVYVFPNVYEHLCRLIHLSMGVWKVNVQFRVYVVFVEEIVPLACYSVPALCDRTSSTKCPTFLAECAWWRQLDLSESCHDNFCLHPRPESSGEWSWSNIYVPVLVCVCWRAS